MDSILNYMDHDYSVLLGAVKCLPMSLADRDTVTQTIIQQCSKIKVLALYLFFLSATASYCNNHLNFYSELNICCFDWQQPVNQYGTNEETRLATM